MENHSLKNEFPEYEEKIHELKVSNNHFHKLFEEYEELNHHLQGLESTMSTTDEHFHEMKAKRLALKDELFQILQSS